MCEQSQDTNVAADEVLQLRLKELVKRPGYGTVGKPIKLACNYFPLIKLQKVKKQIRKNFPSKPLEKISHQSCQF
ncbi:Protein argonaute-1 [Trichinella spiralis]|uniref:Protein argonaute-1 n=1 Tax=Trichinella spiralis TaxID=6334 RepID=A0ABR3KMP3_TRISP